jgi:hypothetical protein
MILRSTDMERAGLAQTFLTRASLVTVDPIRSLDTTCIWYWSAVDQAGTGDAHAAAVVALLLTLLVATAIESVTQPKYESAFPPLPSKFGGVIFQDQSTS